ncbi:hypothetical protein D3C73_731730 [compost metagenome]
MQRTVPMILCGYKNPFSCPRGSDESVLFPIFFKRIIYPFSYQTQRKLTKHTEITTEGQCRMGLITEYPLTHPFQYCFRRHIN